MAASISIEFNAIAHFQVTLTREELAKVISATQKDLE